VFLVGSEAAIHVVAFNASKASLTEVVVLKDLQLGLVKQISLSYSSIYYTELNGHKLGQLAFKQSLDKIQI